jgi:predicted ATPase
LAYLAVILWILGYPQQARRWQAEAFQYAEVLNQANLTAHVRVYGGAGLDELLGASAGVREHADAVIDLANRHNLHYFRLSGLFLRGWAMAREGNIDGGLALMRRSATDRLALGVGWYQIRYLCMLAMSYLDERASEDGARVISEAKDLVARNDEHMWEAELKRIEGEWGRIQGASAVNIETCLQQALKVARSQSAKSFELRAAISLARFWRDEGKCTSSRELLTPIYEWFTEGFDTPDLQAAKELLDAVA